MMCILYIHMFRQWMYSRGCRLLSSLNPRLRCSPGDWCCHLDVGKRVSQPKQGDRAVLLPLTSNNGKHKSLETLEKPSKHHRNRSSQLNQKSLQDLTSTKTYVGFNTCVKAAVPWCSMFFLSGFGVDLANTCEQGSLNNMFDIQKDRLNAVNTMQTTKRVREVTAESRKTSSDVICHCRVPRITLLCMVCANTLCFAILSWMADSGVVMSTSTVDAIRGLKGAVLLNIAIDVSSICAMWSWPLSKQKV